MRLSNKSDRLGEGRVQQHDPMGGRLAMPVTQERSHIQGPADAAVTLGQYGDYE